MPAVVEKNLCAVGKSCEEAFPNGAITIPEELVYYKNRFAGLVP